MMLEGWEGECLDHPFFVILSPGNSSCDDPVEKSGIYLSFFGRIFSAEVFQRRDFKGRKELIHLHPVC